YTLISPSLFTLYLHPRHPHLFPTPKRHMHGHPMRSTPSGIHTIGKTTCQTGKFVNCRQAMHDIEHSRIATKHIMTRRIYSLHWGETEQSFMPHLSFLHPEQSHPSSLSLWAHSDFWVRRAGRTTRPLFELPLDRRHFQ